MVGSMAVQLGGLRAAHWASKSADQSAVRWACRTAAMRAVPWAGLWVWSRAAEKVRLKAEQTVECLVLRWDKHLAVDSAASWVFLRVALWGTSLAVQMAGRTAVCSAGVWGGTKADSKAGWTVAIKAVWKAECLAHRSAAHWA